MDDRNAAWTRRRDPATLVLTLLANFGETGREDVQTITVVDFIRLTQFGRENHKASPDAGLKELKVTWVKKPEEPDSEE